MAKVTDQNIPSELLDLYKGVLHPAAIYKGGKLVRKRYPWRLPWCQGDGRVKPDYPMGAQVSEAQFLHRRYFRRSCDCYNVQDKTHDILDPPMGPKSRGYWFDQANGSGLWYYDYFMQQTLTPWIANDRPPLWCRFQGDALAAECWVGNPPPDKDCDDWFMYVKKEFDEREVYYNLADINPRVFEIYIMHLKQWGAYPGKPYTLKINVWQCSTDWDIDSLWWTNRPNKIRLITSLYLPYPPGYWVSIELPNHVGAIGLVTSLVQPDPAAPMNMWFVSSDSIYSIDEQCFFT